MANSRNHNSRVNAGESKVVVEFAGFAKTLQKFADMKSGKGRLYYTRIPDLERGPGQFKRTASLFVQYDRQREVFAAGQLFEKEKLGMIFLVNHAGEVVRFNDSIDPLSYMGGIEIDGAVKYTITKKSPPDADEYVKSCADHIVREIEKCGTTPSLASQIGR